MRLHLFLGLFCLALACHGIAAESVEASDDCLTAEPYYFPVGLPKPHQPWPHVLVCDRYTEHLRSMEEPTLRHRAATEGARVYRLVILRTFDNPVALRLELAPEGHWRLIEKATNGSVRDGPGNLVFSRKRALTAEETQGFQATLAAVDLENIVTDNVWEILAKGIMPTDEIPEILFEAVHNHRHRILRRFWSKTTMEPEFLRLLESFRSMSAILRGDATQPGTR